MMLRVSPSADPSAIAKAVKAFFDEHEVASLRLPSGWFGRPYDNWHDLTESGAEGGALLIRLDDSQVLTIEADSVSSEGLVLRIHVRGGRWRWTDYGGDAEHEETLGPGLVEFYAPFHP
jgi:hypothetical protein